VRRVPECPQLDNWFKLEITMNWERVAFHVRVAFLVRHHDQGGRHEAQRTPNAPPRTFRVSKFFPEVYHMNEECGAFRGSDTS